MLTTVLEMVFILLASVGLASILWVALARRIFPASGGKDLFAVVRGRGRGDELEQDVRDLLRLRHQDLFQGTVLIVDCGLEEEGKALARLLCANGTDIKFCQPEEVMELIFHT